MSYLGALLCVCPRFRAVEDDYMASELQDVLGNFLHLRRLKQRSDVRELVMAFTERWRWDMNTVKLRTGRRYNGIERKCRVGCSYGYTRGHAYPRAPLESSSKTGTCSEDEPYVGHILVCA
jgi:hypothetical protein